MRLILTITLFWVKLQLVKRYLRAIWFFTLTERIKNLLLRKLYYSDLGTLQEFN